MNLFTKRFGLVLGGVLGVGALAALAIGASFALFSAHSPGSTTTFTAGTVSLNGPSAVTCPATGGASTSALEPGASGTCTVSDTYAGNLPAYIGATATSTGDLAPDLTFTINGTAQTGTTPVLIGHGTYGQNFIAHVQYTFSGAADNSLQLDTANVTVTFYAVQCSTNGSQDSQSPNEGCGQAGPYDWSVPMYDSLIPPSQYIASQSYGGTGLGELGNEITFGNGGGTVSNVVVGMANFTPTATSMPITLNIYNAPTGLDTNTPGSLITSDTQTFSIPAAPNGGNDSTYCQSGAGSSDFTCGIANFDIDFNQNLSGITFPSTVIVGIEYDAYQYPQWGGVNVQLSNETNQISAGSDTAPVTLFAAGQAGESSANDYAPGEISCSATENGGSFSQYSTTAGTVNGNACGASPYIPAVEFTS